MTPSRGRRRQRSSVQSCKRTGKAAVAVLGLLALSAMNETTSTTVAFTLPQNVARLQSRSLTRMYHAPGDDEESQYLVHNSPIRTNLNQPLARLTHGQEVALLRRMRENPAHSSVYQTARQTLLLHNLPLVQSIVTKVLSARPHLAVRSGGVKRGDNHGSNTGNEYHGTVDRTEKPFTVSSAAESRAGAALTRDDLLHEGTIGLAEAIDKYDLAYAYEEDAKGFVSSPPEGVLPKGARLGTYATYWIRARILRAIQSREHAVRFPEHALQASHRLVRAAKEMRIDWSVVGELAEYDVISASQERLRKELKEKAGISSDGLLRDAVRVKSMSRRTTRLESWMSPSSPAVSGEFSDGMLSSGAGQEHILETLSKFLMPREVEVLSLRYGLVPAETKTKEQESDQFFRDYQAEAEEDLFGPDGILSHYSTTSNGDATVASASAVSNRADTIRARAAPSLLPFKEIGRRMKFSGEYCRRTCAGALNKLTRAAEEGKLAESDFLLGW